MSLATDYPILTERLRERMETGRSATLEAWILDADRGLSELTAQGGRAARGAASVRRSLALAAGLVEKLALAATQIERSG
ncbi:MAG: hypothetical protein KDB53_01025 [Planctomycetes bacterium]|nr:hypothetical protein [Planctomycetota bacterium]